MNSLGSNDCAFIFNRKLLLDLAASRENEFRELFEAATEREPALHRELGIESSCLQNVNLQHAVARHLYATTEEIADGPGGATDLERLAHRFRQYQELAQGRLLNDAPISVPGLPCPISVREHPGSRVTFVRDLREPIRIEVVRDAQGEGVEVAFSGTAYRGGIFSHHKATHPAEVTGSEESHHTFTLTLRYELEFLDDVDINLDAVPFQMVTDPPPPSTPGKNRLPPSGGFVFARATEVEDASGERMDIWPLPGPGTDPGTSLFLGRLGTELWEDVVDPTLETGRPRYRVVSHVTETAIRPEKLVLCIIDDKINTCERSIVAEARAGRFQLTFRYVKSLQLAPSLPRAAIDAIGASLVKINPTFAQGAFCVLPDAPDCDAPEWIPPGFGLEELSMLGPSALNMPLFPRTVVFPVHAAVDDTERWVTSEVQTCELTRAHYFPPDRFAISGSNRTDCASDPCSLEDFSAGADFAMGVSAGPNGFMQPTLDRMGDRFSTEILNLESARAEGVATASAAVSLEDGYIRVRVTGEGTKPIPVFFLPDIDYEYSITVPIRLVIRRAIAVDADGRPTDRFSCPISDGVLHGLRLYPIPVTITGPHGTTLVIPPNFETQLFPDEAEKNPLSFRAYFDPLGGTLCASCSPAVRIPPATYRNGQLVEITDPSDPPELCDEHTQTRDRTDRFGQASFLANGGLLKPVYEFLPQPPKEDDLDVDVTIDAWSAICSVTVGAFFFAGAAPIYQQVITTVLPFVNLFAEGQLAAQVTESLERRNPYTQGVNPDLGLPLEAGLFLTDPSVLAPVRLQKDAFLLRYSVVWQRSGAVEGC